MSININSISDKQCDKCESGILLGTNSKGQQVHGCGSEEFCKRNIDNNKNGAYGIRTRDLNNANVTRSQLR